MGNADSRFILHRVALEGDPSLIPVLQDIAYAYAITYRSFARQAFYAILMLGETPESFITIAEETAAEYPLLARNAIRTAAIRADSSLYIRVLVLQQTTNNGVSAGRFEMILNLESDYHYRTMPIEDQAMRLPGSLRSIYLLRHPQRPADGYVGRVIAGGSIEPAS